MVIQRFSSDAFSESAKVTAIQEFWSGSLGMDIDVDPNARTAFSTCACALPGLSLAAFSGSPAKMTRSYSQACEAESALVLCIAERAKVRVTSGAGERIFAEGEVHVWQSDSPTSCEVDRDYSAQMITIPTDVLAQHGVDSEHVLDSGIAAPTPELGLLFRYTRDLITSLDGLSAAGTLSASGHLRDLIVLALSDPREREHSSMQSSVGELRLQRIKTDVRKNLLSRCLSVDWIARREGISTRYLRELFASQNTSFAHFVLAERLALCRQRLRDPRFRNKNISTLAYECGFGDLSYFCRTFKQRYGATPSSVRASATL